MFPLASPKDLKMRNHTAGVMIEIEDVMDIVSLVIEIVLRQKGNVQTYHLSTIIHNLKVKFLDMR